MSILLPVIYIIIDLIIGYLFATVFIWISNKVNKTGEMSNSFKMKATIAIVWTIVGVLIKLIYKN
ncbi:UNVERIFIED_CONTAM: heme/copper-type cytochrome/quinol oxidase subunit 2 [Paenibacillus sp. PvR008]